MPKDERPQSDLKHVESIQDALSRAASHLSDAAELLGLAARFCELAKDTTLELWGLELQAARHGSLEKAFSALAINRALAEFALTTAQLSVPPRVIITPPPESDNSATVYGCFACPGVHFATEREAKDHEWKMHGGPGVATLVREGRSSDDNAKCGDRWSNLFCALPAGHDGRHFAEHGTVCWDAKGNRHEGRSEPSETAKSFAAATMDRLAKVEPCGALPSWDPQNPCVLPAGHFGPHRDGNDDRFELAQEGRS